MRTLALVMVLLAAPATVGAQTAVLSQGRSALMIQGGADLPRSEQKAGDTELLHFNGVQYWGAVTGMIASGSRTSLLLGVSLSSGYGKVENLGQFAVAPSGGYYPRWDQSGYTVRLQAGTIIWFK